MDVKKYKKKKKKSSLKGVAFYLLLIVTASLLALGYNKITDYFQTELAGFELSDIRITGNFILSEKEILKTIGFKEGDKLLEISAGQVAEKLKKSPYLRSVSAVYSLPSTLRINVVERKPVAFIYGRGLNMIDNEGFILPVPDNNFRWNLPVITHLPESLGLQGAETVSEKAKKVVEIVSFISFLEMPFSQMVSEINCSKTEYLEIGLTGTETIIKLNPENYQQQLFVAAKYMKDYMDFKNLNKIEYVDVRLRVYLPGRSFLPRRYRLGEYVYFF